MEGLKTKEDTLKEEYSKLIINPDKVYAQNPSIIQAAHTAMDLYSEQRAIAFAEWINGEMYECFLHSDENVKFWHDWEGNGNHTTEDLYKIFLSTL